MNASHNIRVTNWQKILHQIVSVRWQPDRHTFVAIGSYFLVLACMVTAFQIITPAHIAANFILFGPITLAGIGVALPVFYTVLKRQRSLADVGLTRRYLFISLGLSLLLGLDTYRNTLATLDLSWSRILVPLISMALTVGLFEAIFFRGWLQLRFEEAFGILPAILLGALCYALYHVGYGMAANEMVFLFAIGLVFGTVFRLTKNVFVLWPLFTPIGGLYTNLSEGLVLPFEATYGFILTMAMMFAVIVAAKIQIRPNSEIGLI